MRVYGADQADGGNSPFGCRRFQLRDTRMTGADVGDAVRRTSAIGGLYKAPRDYRHDGNRFSHIERLQEDPTIPELFEIESVVGDDTVRRFFKSVDPVLGAEWIARHAKPMWGALPDPIILDWDSTVQPK